jgi:DMSO/TMAO reductase YedYZ molybdopterin-dependent catalytic subunit
VSGDLQDDRVSGEPTGQRRVRFSRRRVLVLGGALVAGFAGTIEFFRRLAGSGQETGIGGWAADAFGPFPVRSVEDVPVTPLEDWVIRVDGLVETPLRIRHADWVGLQRGDLTADLHCVEGWTVDDLRWGGVSPATLLDLAGVKPEGMHVNFIGHGGTYHDSLPIELVRDPQTVLADTLDGEPLPHKHGGPVRLVVPVQLGYKSVKWVTRLEVTARPVRGYWSKRGGYPMDAPVKGA